MPRVIKRTPEWLVEPSPGHHLFSFQGSKLHGHGSRATDTSPTGSLRTIAKGRGSEIFVASGNELRWADLGALKQDFQEVEAMRNRASQTAGHKAGDAESGYRTLKVPGSGTITQLVVSPEREFLAIVRSHQIYVAILPDLRHLRETDVGTYKLKCFHLGPTIHCVEEAAVVSVLWHPLGEYGRCLVTVTSDSVVRLWEISKDDRSTFEQPSTAIDLKKLANAVSADQDFSASKFGSAKGFTPDSAELEPAAVCFGGRGFEGENPWHSMTLWLATKGGDIYTLCPLLPKRFETAADFIESLSVLVAAKQLEAQEDKTKLLTSDAQAEFLASLQEQEPMLAQGASEFETRYIYCKPHRPGPAPKLQGPFEIDPELEEDSEFVDIYVTPFETPQEQAFDEDQELPGSSSLVCVLTSLNQVLTMVDFDGIDGQWVPSRGTPFSTPKNRGVIVPEDYHTLNLFEIIHLNSQNDNISMNFSTITPDIVSPHAFFVTGSTGVHYISAARWTRNILNELAEKDDVNNTSSIRLDTLLESAQSLVEHLIVFPRLASSSSSPPPVACLVFADSHISRSGLGYFILTTRANEPWAAQLDISDSDLSTLADAEISFDDLDSIETYSLEPYQRKLILAEPRDVYRPDPAFERPSVLPTFIREQSSDRKTAVLLMEDVDLESMPLLEIMIATHHRIQGEFEGLNKAANGLFTQTKRLRDSLLEQIRRVRELKEIVERVTGDDDENGGSEDCGLQSEVVKLNLRVTEARERQKNLAERVDRLKNSLSRISTKQLSDKEKAFKKELEDFDCKLNSGEYSPRGGVKSSALMDRIMEVTTLSASLTKQAKESLEEGEGQNKRVGSKGNVSSGFRKAKIQGVMELLEREQIAVDRAAEKLERLKV
ncbi:uncharacterized protein PV09_04458 [Verruconis gallopava]|uniref:Uncharacterized protein n=1 Tax=Verruconis gallopava TaxID=253628 RepID=A0A0D1XQ65_9PEZI|nr:uncharacterized protein PV09_04458 [Verruconis gallopava]KIW04726.1 hypothetical protein PV09_04458 [Verruconis gallopava]